MVPSWLQLCSSSVPGLFQLGSSLEPAQFRAVSTCCQLGPSLGPGWFQAGSCLVPALFQVGSTWFQPGLLFLLLRYDYDYNSAAQMQLPSEEPDHATPRPPPINTSSKLSSTQVCYHRLEPIGLGGSSVKFADLTSFRSIFDDLALHGRWLDCAARPPE